MGTVARAFAVLAVAVVVGGCSSTPRSAPAPPETMPMSVDDWRPRFLDQLDSSTPGITNCVQAVNLVLDPDELTALAKVLDEDLDEQMRAAGNPQPSVSDREWAVEAGMENTKDVCRQRYGPRLGTAPPDLLVDVKYRDTPVDLGAPGFIEVPIEPSGDVRQAWWDSDNDYLVIDLSGTLYHYCAFGESRVEALAGAADSHDHYQSSVRGTSDCRYEGTVPSYEQTNLAYDGWNDWIEATHQQLSIDFDLDPEGRSARLDFIAEVLITYCVSKDGEEADLDVLDEWLREQVAAGDVDPDLALFWFAVAEIYNHSPVEREHCSS